MSDGFDIHIDGLAVFMLIFASFFFALGVFVGWLLWG